MQHLPPEDLSFTRLEREIPRGRLSIGHDQVELPGARIVAAYALEQADPCAGYLFFTSDDILYGMSFRSH